jgi:hypothetical protein
MTTIAIGATVRPANNGEDTAGRVLHWTRRCPYPTRLPAGWLAPA